MTRSSLATDRYSRNKTRLRPTPAFGWPGRGVRLARGWVGRVYGGDPITFLGEVLAVASLFAMLFLGLFLAAVFS